MGFQIIWNLVERRSQEPLRAPISREVPEGVANPASDLVDLEQLILLHCSSHTKARRQVRAPYAADNTPENIWGIRLFRSFRTMIAWVVLYHESVGESKINLHPTELILKHLDELEIERNGALPGQEEDQPRIGKEVQPAIAAIVVEVVVYPVLLIQTDHLSCGAKCVVLQFHVVHFHVPP